MPDINDYNIQHISNILKKFIKKSFSLYKFGRINALSLLIIWNTSYYMHGYIENRKLLVSHFEIKIPVSKLYVSKMLEISKNYVETRIKFQ